MAEDDLRLDYNISLPLGIPRSMIAKEFESRINQETEVAIM